MVCIYCGGDTKVINSRVQKKTNQVWRRRQCLSCEAVFTTIERVDFYGAVVFMSASGHTEPFSRDTLLMSIYDSLKYRQDALTAATALLETILSKLLPRINNATITRPQIVDTASEVLKNFDHPAYVQYLAYHPE